MFMNVSVEDEQLLKTSTKARTQSRCVRNQSPRPIRFNTSTYTETNKI